jgi:hypothetical protein
MAPTAELMEENHPFHKKIVFIEQMVSDKKIFMGISHIHIQIFSSETPRANCNPTLVEWSLDGPLPKKCPVILC